MKKHPTAAELKKYPFYPLLLEFPEVPPGYWEACEEYSDFEPDSIEEIWYQLDHRDQFKKGFPRTKGKAPQNILGLEASEEIAGFQQRIMKAVDDRDFVFLGKLFKAMKLPNQPEPEMNAYRAAIEAFSQLFLDKGRKTREEWPTKKMVRERAEEILKQAGHLPKTNRHWPRVFKEVGLSDLPARRYKRT